MTERSTRCQVQSGFPGAPRHGRRTLGLLLVALAVTGCQTKSPWDFSDVNLRERLGAATPPEDAPLPENSRFGFDRDLEAPAETGPLRLSVEQAVVVALKQNRALRVEQINPVIAGTFEKLERAAFDPSIFAEASLLREKSQEVSRATGQSFGVKRQDTNISTGLAQKLPTGTDLAVGVTHDRTYSNRSPEQHQLRPAVSVTQALLRGADFDANVARIQQAALDTLATEYQLRGFAEALVAQVETTWWDYVLAGRQVVIFENSLKLAQKQQDGTQQRITVGQLAETELAAAKAEVALRNQALINARAKLDQYRLQLLSLLNTRSGEGWNRAIDVVDVPELPATPLDDVNQHVELAIQLRPEISEAQLQIERGRLEVVQTRNGLLPKLDLFVTLGKSGFAQSFPDVVGNLTDNDYDLRVGGRFEYPLGNRAAEADHERALATRYQAAMSLKNLAQLVELDVRVAHSEAKRTLEQVQASAATRQLEEEKVRAEMEKFGVGKSTSLLVAQAQRDLLLSQVVEVEAVINHRKAMIDLFRLDGSLLKRRAIQSPGREPYAKRSRAAK